MVEALGEFEFNLSPNVSRVNVEIKVRRALAPSLETAWAETIKQLLGALETALTRD
jgi:hypothetical protein